MEIVKVETKLESDSEEVLGELDKELEKELYYEKELWILQEEIKSIKKCLKNKIIDDEKQIKENIKSKNSLIAVRDRLSEFKKCLITINNKLDKHIEESEEDDEEDIPRETKCRSLINWLKNKFV